MTYDGVEHVRIAALPGMWERTLTVGSAGKSFAATGWRVGEHEGRDVGVRSWLTPLLSRRMAYRPARAHDRDFASLDPNHFLHKLPSTGGRRDRFGARTATQILRGTGCGLRRASRRALFVF